MIRKWLRNNLEWWVFENEMRKKLLFLLKMQGVVASGIAFAVQIWCIDRGGPVFVAVYQPVQTLVVAIMASIALGEEFYLGGWVLLFIYNYVLIISCIHLVLY